MARLRTAGVELNIARVDALAPGESVLQYMGRCDQMRTYANGRCAPVCMRRAARLYDRFRVTVTVTVTVTERSDDVLNPADFRKDNGTAIRQVCSQFVALCRRLRLFSEALVAIDSSKFKAVNNSDRAFTQGKLRGRMQQLEESVGRYLEELDRADRSPTLVSEERTTHIKKKMRAIKAQIRRLQGIGQQLAEAPDGQVSLTDPDARCMATSSRSSPVVAYNVQTAVDAQHHLIVAHEVTNVGHDRQALAPMAEQAREAMGTEKLTAIADRGYFSGEQLLKCEQQGITALVSKPSTSNNRSQGLFDKRDFEYLPEKDEYRCPAGERAIHRFTTVERGQTIHKYWSSACPDVP